MSGRKEGDAQIEREASRRLRISRMPTVPPPQAILTEFAEERERAHQLHGAHSQEGNAWDSERSLRILVEEVGECAKALNERDLGNFTDLVASWELRKELIQTGAMCLVWIANIDRDMPNHE